MPKRTGPKTPRAHNLPSADPRVRRPVRPAPRPSATVPVGSAVGAEFYREPAPETAPTSVSRATSPGRVYRPARASALPLIVDYSYVVSDLKRIGLLAGVAFAVLIGLTFVVH